MSHEAALYEFRFPDIGEGLTEGTVVELRVTPGQTVKPGQALAIVETDKVVTEMPSPVGGILVELPIVKGQVVKVGEIVARIRTAGSAAPPVARETEPAYAESGTVVGTLDTTSGGILPPSTEGESSLAAGNGANGTSKKVRASPVARRLAAISGLDITRITGTGPGGRILKKDLAAQAPSSPSATVGETHKLTTLRLAIANAMEKSQAIPAAAVHDYTLVEDLLQLRRDMNGASKEKVGLLAFFVKATALALRDFPLLSSTYSAERKEYQAFLDPNIGIAVDTEEGLVVPVVKSAAALSVLKIQAEILRLTEKAKTRTLLLEEDPGGKLHNF